MSVEAHTPVCYIKSSDFRQQHAACTTAVVSPTKPSALPQALQEPSGNAAAPGVGILMGVAVPLIQQMIVEGKAAEGGGHELKVRAAPDSPLESAPRMGLAHLSRAVGDLAP